MLILLYHFLKLHFDSDNINGVSTFWILRSYATLFW